MIWFYPGFLETANQNEVGELRSENDITYHFYSKRHPSNSIQIKTSSAHLLEYTDFDKKKDNLFIIHGWRSSNESSVNYKIRERILSKNDLNVFVVDWSSIAGRNYISAQGSVRTVGEYVAGFVRRLKSLYNVKVNTIKFVGHSLGAQVAGCAGKYS